MALKTGAEYLDSIESHGLEAHILGQKTGDLTEHGLVQPSRQAVAFTYDTAHRPETRELFCVESPLSKDTVNRFTHIHQSTEDLVNKVKMQRYGGCKVGVGDVLIGAAALMARMNGVAEASHIKDKIVEMIHLNETIYACGLACSATGEQTPAGNYQVNLLSANVCKLNVTRFPFELARLATDIAGGLLGTMPSAADLEDPVTGPYIQKYLAASPDSRVVDRMKVLRLIENLVAGAGAVGYLIESMHGAPHGPANYDRPPGRSRG